MLRDLLITCNVFVCMTDLAANDLPCGIIIMAEQPTFCACRTNAFLPMSITEYDFTCFTLTFYFDTYTTSIKTEGSLEQS